MAQKNYNKGFTKIDKLLTKTVKSYKLETALHRHQVLKQWQGVADSFLEDSTKQTRALDLKKGVLVVACLTKEAASLIRLLAQRIIYALNALLGRQVVYSIYLEV